MTNPKHVTHFAAASLGGQDSVLIASSSFEARCLGFLSTLASIAPGYRVDSAIRIRYADRGDSAVRGRVTRHESRLQELLARISTHRVQQQPLEPYALIEGAEYFAEIAFSLPRGASVVVDMSTLTKLHVLQLLRSFCGSPRISTLRLTYTRARYGRYDTLSWGAEEPVVLPAFGRPQLPEQSRPHLVLFCGLEPDRSYSVWRRFGQDSCTAVFIDSGEDDLDQCVQRARRLHGFCSGSTKTLPAFQPSVVCDYLVHEYQKLKRMNRYMYIAPLTTKWEIVGVHNFFQTVGYDAGCAIVYAAPGRLNATGHTRDELGDCLSVTVKAPNGG